MEQMRVIYAHLLLKDKEISRRQLAQLKAVLYVPKCGESLVCWGNSQYGGSVSVVGALERVIQAEQEAKQERRDCAAYCCSMWHCGWWRDVYAC